MPETVVELKEITCVRAGRTILSGVSWRIARGEHWALLGANGSGKTTLLKIITGYEWPTRGTVKVLGRRFGACDLTALRRRVGWVSSSLEHRLHGDDTALEVAVSGFEASIGVYRQFSAAERSRARAALRTEGVGALEDRPYGVLSQGEQQRVLIARALANRPALLILDEPCAGLDPVAREHFLDDMGRLARRRGAPTMVFVTHHVEEIGPWIKRLLVLRGGDVLAAGRTSDVLTSEVMSEALGRPCTVRRAGARWSLDLPPLVGLLTR